MPEANDFLALEHHLVERLKAALADMRQAVHVLTGAQLSGIDEQKQLTPAVHVIHAGFRVTQSRADGRAAQLEHTWYVVAAVKASSQIRSGAQAREQAGQLAAVAGSAVMGLKVPGLTRDPLILTSAPGARYSEGFLYLPLAFTAATVFTAQEA
jgi:phage gp37-like protein